jgi:hypothetical protein
MTLAVIAVVQGAFLNGRPIRVSDATAVGHARIMNNIGASRDAAFARKTLNRIEVLLEHKVQVCYHPLPRFC